MKENRSLPFDKGGLKDYYKIMAQKIAEKVNQKSKVDQILKELKLIRNQLQKFLLLIPKESLKEYKNADEIKKAYLRTIETYSPK